MRSRCSNESNKFYGYYGGRGIVVCERWTNDFWAFVSDMGDRPAGFSIDRIDNNGPYSPENCRWASRKDQARNQRQTRVFTIDGVEYKASDLSEKYGVKTDTIMGRAAEGLPLELIIKKGKVRDRGSWKVAVAKRVANQLARTHCKHGHEFTPENTYVTAKQRACRMCHRLKVRKQVERKKELAKPPQ